MHTGIPVEHSVGVSKAPPYPLPRLGARLPYLFLNGRDLRSHIRRRDPHRNALNVTLIMQAVDDSLLNKL